MTAQTLRELAAYHRREAKGCYDAADNTGYHRTLRDSFLVKGNRHNRWADELEQLAASFQSLVKPTSDHA